MSELQKALKNVLSQVVTAHFKNESIRSFSPYPNISTESKQLPVLEGETTDGIEVENIQGDKVFIPANEKIAFEVDQGKTDRGVVYASTFEVVNKPKT